MSSTLHRPPPLALYVHIPWCARKCPYCDFNSHVHADSLPETAYVEALLRDLDGEREAVADRPVESIFIGGGTPSLFTPETVDSLLQGLGKRLTIDPAAEITLEANPGTLERGRLGGFRQSGVNRLSLGVQSFNDEALRRIGRIHNADDARRAVEVAAHCGFDSINVDLMYALPGQTVREALADVRAAVALGPDHLSHYQLTIEPDTAFHHRPPPLPVEEDAWRMQLACQSELARAGYTQYEVSAYARAGHRCAHNLNYWRFGDYLGIGAGAHQKLTAAGRVERRWKRRLPAAYLEQPPVEGTRLVEGNDLVFEFMLNALRLTEGFEDMLFTERTGLAPEVLEGPLHRACEQGLMETRDHLLRPTETGRRFLNELTLLFME